MSYPPVRKCTDYCGMNMSTNIPLQTRTRCYSFDQYVRKCNDRLDVNMMNKIALYIRTEWYLLCYRCCVKHPAHRNSKSRVYPLRCQDSGLPTRSCTAAAAADVAVRCCYCCDLGTGTHTKTVSDRWVEGIHTTSRDTPSRLRSKQALTSTVAQ